MRHLNGADYVALVPIYMPRGPKMVVVAAVGKPCDKVPVESLEGLIRRGKIQKKKEQADG